MSKLKVVICDVCGRDDSYINGPIHVDKDIQVIFIPEQTEGSIMDPYLSLRKIDICENCFSHIIKSSRYLLCSKSKGCYAYKFDSSDEIDIS